MITRCLCSSSNCEKEAFSLEFTSVLELEIDFEISLLLDVLEGSDDVGGLGGAILVIDLLENIEGIVEDCEFVLDDLNGPGSFFELS